MTEPKLVSASVWMYRCLLGAYPRDFRRDYGESMVQVFRDLCLREGESGLAEVWGRAMMDYAVSLVSEHMNRGVEMTRSKWIQLSGWGLAASGILFFIGLFGADRPTYHPNNAASWPVDRFFNAYSTIIAAMALVLMAAGMAGLLVRFGSRAGSLGKTGLVLGSVAGVISAVGAAGLGLVDEGPWWNLFFLSFIVVNVGLFLFGIACLRERLFTRWNGVPLVVGSLNLLFILANMGLIPWQAPDSLVTVMFVLFALGMSLVGYRLVSEAEGQRAALA